MKSTCHMLLLETGAQLNLFFALPMFSVLQAADGRCHNRFDRGPVSNCTEFWEQGWPDWGAVYEDDERVRDRE